jgi:hypothetical protein
MKKATTIAVIVVLLFALSVSVTASSNTISKDITYRDIKITINGEALTPTDGNGNPTEPFIMDGSTYLPVRAVAGALGLEVGWDGETSTVILIQNEHANVYITRTGSKYHYDATCNGGTYWPVPMETAIGMGLNPCEKCVLTIAHPEG